MARAALRLGIRELAALAKVAPMTISRLETGRSGGDAPGVRVRKKR
jgi:transcriptional regulator with XRE-family HTH domain